MLNTTDGPVSIVDADSHILEPPDLWTSRVAKRFVNQVPAVEVSPRTGHHHWRIGSQWIWPVGYFAQAGFTEYPPIQPWEYEDVQTSAFDAMARLKRLDEYGVDIQILYPNIVGFQAPLLLKELGPDVALICMQTYNDFALQWSSADPHRLVPIAALPYWDVDASVREIKRCVSFGFRGVLFANKFERVGLPPFTDPHWDPVYATAQEYDLPVNFHVGFSSPEASELLNEDSISEKRGQAVASRPQRALWAGSLLLSQCDVLGRLLTSGLCERFPRVKLVSIETGFGHIPFYLECLDWHWKAYGVPTSSLLPSEYFARQCYGTFWFERGTLHLLDQYPDNFLFSTDYPHSTGGSPGPCSPAIQPAQYVLEAFKGIDVDIMRKAVWENANQLYKLEA